jgi:site-specific recombinase XerD
MAVNNGCDIYVVQHLLGHASPTTTQRYAHLRQDTLRNASEMLAERINSARPNL